ncbi:MAG: hypothetical protein AVDCRST_MAG79-129, partial [uncultured Thermoleophilia bacterium]
GAGWRRRPGSGCGRGVWPRTARRRRATAARRDPPRPATCSRPWRARSGGAARHPRR